MERQQSFKLERKSSLKTEPRTLSKEDYELAMAALQAYLSGNIKEEGLAGKDKKAVNPAPAEKEEGKPGANPAKTGVGTGGSDMKLPALT